MTPRIPHHIPREIHESSAPFRRAGARRALPARQIMADARDFWPAKVSRRQLHGDPAAGRPRPSIPHSLRPSQAARGVARRVAGWISAV